MYYIAVDAGGTKTYAAILDENKNIHFDYETGHGNFSVNENEAWNHFIDSVSACLTSKYGSACKAVVLGAAGIEKGSIKEKLLSKWKETFHLPLLVLTDAELAYYSIFGKNNGILAIAGTGSILIGKNNGHFYTVGGWGHLLGDEGSSYYIAIEALKIIAKDLDFGRLSNFSKEIAQKIKIDNKHSLKQFVYSSTKSKIARLSLDVYHLAKKGDQKSISIIKKAAHSLYIQTFQLLEILQWKGLVSVGCKGSLLEKNEIFQHFYKQSFINNGLDVKLIFSNTPIVIGAISAWSDR